MLNSISQVNEEFFRLFHGIKLSIKGVETPIPCRYAKKSSYDYVEEQDNQRYPCIAIQDFTPTPKKEWFIDMKAYFGGKSVDGLTGFLYQRPIWMEFRYDVSIAAKGYHEYMAIQDYFMENFVYGKRFLFCKHLTGEDTVGEVVPYEIRDTDIPRTDGVFEKNYEFTLAVWLHPQKPEEVTLIQEIVLSLGRKVDVDSNFVSSDGKTLITTDETVFDTSLFRSKHTAAEIENIFDKAALVGGDVVDVTDV